MITKLTHRLLCSNPKTLNLTAGSYNMLVKLSAIEITGLPALQKATGLSYTTAQKYRSQLLLSGYIKWADRDAGEVKLMSRVIESAMDEPTE